MKINEDISRIVRLLLDEPTSKKGIGKTTIYSNRDKYRHLHCPAYKHSNTIPKMAEMGLVKILEVKEHGKPVGMEIHLFPYYEVQFTIEKIRDYLDKKKVKVMKKTLEDKLVKTKAKTQKPYCLVEKGWGYLKFGKFGKKIKIGHTESRHFSLLSCLLEPMEATKTVEMVFEAIRQPKDKEDSNLANWNTSKTRKVEIIQYAIKDLQKKGKLAGKIKFEFNNTKSQIKAKLIE